MVSDGVGTSHIRVHMYTRMWSMHLSYGLLPCIFIMWLCACVCALFCGALTDAMSMNDVVGIIFALNS